jgi:hypothetical protein
MHQEIEKLIDLALADGQITEKERNVILKKATELGIDPDEVELVLDGRLHQLEANKPKQKEKVGNVKTCPSCGGLVKSFQIKCENCDHEFRETKATKSITAFYEELKSIPLKEQAIIISSFPIPSNKEDIIEFKEDIIEFLTISIGNCKRLTRHEKATYLEDSWHGRFSKDLGYRESIINAWQAKTIQAINKGKLLFENDNTLINEITRYEKQYNEIIIDPDLKEDKKVASILKIGLGGMLLIFILFTLYTTIMGGNVNEERKKEKEKLENIELKILEAIDEKKIDKALILNEQLHWHYFSEWDREDQKYINYWDKKREDLKSTIEKLK